MYSSDRHGENDGNAFWDGFKKEWSECENEECKVWVSMRILDGWKGGEGRFKCGLCVMKDVVEVRNENEKLKRQMEQMKRLTNEKTLKNSNE